MCGSRPGRRFLELGAPRARWGACRRGRRRSIGSGRRGPDPPAHRQAGRDERARAWAVDNRRSGVTLTTFSHVRWNRPLFEHLGFRVLEDGEIGSGLWARRLSEAGRGLDPRLRGCMRRLLDP